MKLAVFLTSLCLGFLLTAGIRWHMAGGRPFSPAQRVAIPVSLQPDPAPFHRPLEILIQWGGFYAVKKEEGYEVFRLLEIDADLCHVITYREVFSQLPHINEVGFLVPVNQHFSFPSVEILRLRPHLIGAKVLQAEDLAAFFKDLRDRGVPEQELGQSIRRILQFSREDPLKTWISESQGKVDFDSPQA